LVTFWEYAVVVVYRGAKDHDQSSVLKHFGSLEAAIYRMVTMLIGQNGLVEGNDGRFIYMPYPSIAPRLMNSAEILGEFCAMMNNVSIMEYQFDDSKALALHDVWMDDPIGSGGMAIFDKNAISKDELVSIWPIFKPFEGPIFPKHLHLKYSRKEIKSLIADFKQDKLGAAEYRGRRARARYVGENFHETKYQEAVWVDLTLKLRNWCIQNGYTSFSYKNTLEGNGEKSMVALSHHVVSRTGNVLLFNEALYRKMITPIISNIMNSHLSQFNNGQIMIDKIIWAGKDPTSYWNKQRL